MDERKSAANNVLAKVAVQCSADPDASGWLIIRQLADSASIPIDIGMVKIATFAKPQNVSGQAKKLKELTNKKE